MLRFVVRRLLLLVPILLGLSILVFLWIHALPGGPGSALLGERATAADIREINHRYGLDKPLPIQYWRYLKATVEGDLGISIASRRTVTSEIEQRFPATAQLALAAMIFAVALGIPLGFLAAKFYGSWFDHLSLFASLIGISIPIFFLAVILKYVFAVRLHWLPSVGQVSVLDNFAHHKWTPYAVDAIVDGVTAPAKSSFHWSSLWDVIRHLTLPAIALGSIPLAIVTRITRAAVLDVQNEDYVRTARAKGLSPLIVDRRHILRNALLPVSTIIGLQTGLLLSGAVLTETVFAYPGIGSWLANAIFNRDYPVIQGGVLFLAIVFVMVNLLVDISYAIINPRIRYGR